MATRGPDTSEKSRLRSVVAAPAIPSRADARPRVGRRDRCSLGAVLRKAAALERAHPCVDRRAAVAEASAEAHVRDAVLACLRIDPGRRHSEQRCDFLGREHVIERHNRSAEGVIDALMHGDEISANTFE